MSDDNNPTGDHGEEQESWKDLAGSIFDLAEQITSKISPEEVEEKLRRTVRKGSGRTKPDEKNLVAAGREFVAARGPATEDPEPTGRSGGALCLSLGGRSLTVTLDRTVERSSVSPRNWTRWIKSYRRVPAGRPGSFWDELDEAGQEMFARLAGERIYPAGTALMRQGETADHIVVILDGRTEVSVRDGVSERVVAYRSPGDLIGERAALQVRVRSATVVAVGTVRALVMRSQDFAAFISAHPKVSTFIEKLIKDRLTEEPASQEYGPAAGSAPRTDDDHSPDRPGLDPGGVAEARSTVVATNVLGFGRLFRSAGDRRIMHAAMVEMMRSALTGVSDECRFEDRGDGMLIVIPPVVPTPVIVGRLTGSLSAALRWHNRLYNMCAQIQMRIAVDTGPVESLDQTMPDLVLGRTERLLETPALAQAISDTRANLGMIISSSVYDTAILPYGGPVRYEPVRIEGGDQHQRAWMQMIDPVPERLVAWA